MVERSEIKPSSVWHVTRILSKQLVKAFLLYKPTVRPSQDSISCSMAWSIYPHLRMKPDKCIHGAIMEHVQKVIGVKYSEYWHWQTSFLLRCYTRANHSDVPRPLIGVLGIHSTLLGFSTSHILVGVSSDFFHHNQKARNLKESFPWQCRMTNDNKFSSTGWREDLVWMLRRSPTCNTISNNGSGFLQKSDVNETARPEGHRFLRLWRFVRILCASRPSMAQKEAVIWNAGCFWMLLV